MNCRRLAAVLPARVFPESTGVAKSPSKWLRAAPFLSFLNLAHESSGPGASADYSTRYPERQLAAAARAAAPVWWEKSEQVSDKDVVAHRPVHSRRSAKRQLRVAILATVFLAVCSFLTTISFESRNLQLLSRMQSACNRRFFPLGKSFTDNR